MAVSSRRGRKGEIMPKRIFIDCGGYDGCSVRKIMEQPDPPNRIHSFEPHPRYAKYYKDLPTTFHQQAVWIQGGEIMLYPGGKHIEGSSICPSKSNVDLDKGFKVQCIDLNQWLLDHVTSYDHVTLKLDIEGAEYKVLDYLLRKNSGIRFVNKLFVEWHWPKHPVTTPDFHNRLVERLQAIGLDPEHWDALPWRLK